ncbi:Hypothetical protein NTJ_08605 [Nesidiocoris tenuis]|uniref:Cytochrome b561 domain-containing protein n=1 Tax=Nesidiocoris tenuis TaxID=355587 RepID=A0ABN7AUD6_9HEMI|nr:Hypothetical protein NTJ_08605 [Nesidiocoris tenuis]
MLEPPLLITFAVAQVLGLVAVVFVIMAVVHENDQVTVLTPQAAQNFIWHPLLMTLGMIYLFGCSAVIYRVLQSMEKLHVKMIHACIHMVVLVLALVGLVFAIQVKNAYNAEHFTSLHGLFGLITIILFAVQWVISIPVFLYPKAPADIRAPGMSVHVCLGIGVFLSAVITSMTAFNAKTSGSALPSDQGVIYYKVSAFFYLFYSLVIVYMVTLKKYKRPPDF